MDVISNCNENETCLTEHFCVQITVNDVAIPIIRDEQGLYYIESNLSTTISYKVETEEWVKGEKETQSWPVTPYQIVIRRFSEPNETCYFDIRIDGVKVKSCTVEPNLSRKISGFKDKGTVKEFLFSLPRFTKSATDKLDEARHSQIGLIEIECYEADYVTDAFNDRKRLDYKQASKNDANAVTGGNYTMSTTKVGRVLYTKDATRRVHVWRKRCLLSCVCIRYRMGHTLREMGLDVPAYPEIPPTVQHTFASTGRMPNILRKMNCGRRAGVDSQIMEPVSVKREQLPVVIDLTKDESDKSGSDNDGDDSDVEFLGAKRIKIESVDLTESRVDEGLEDGPSSSNAEGGPESSQEGRGKARDSTTEDEGIRCEIDGEDDEYEKEGVNAIRVENEGYVVVIEEVREVEQEDLPAEPLSNDDMNIAEVETQIGDDNNRVTKEAAAVGRGGVSANSNDELIVPEDVFELLDVDFDHQETTQNNLTDEMIESLALTNVRTNDSTICITGDVTIAATDEVPVTPDDVLQKQSSVLGEEIFKREMHEAEKIVDTDGGRGKEVISESSVAVSDEVNADEEMHESTVALSNEANPEVEKVIEADEEVTSGELGKNNNGMTSPVEVRTSSAMKTLNTSEQSVKDTLSSEDPTM